MSSPVEVNQTLHPLVLLSVNIPFCYLSSPLGGAKYIFGKMVLAKNVYAEFTSLRMCKMSVSVGTSPFFLSKCNKRASEHLL